MRPGQANKIASKLGKWEYRWGLVMEGTHLTSDFNAQVQANLINHSIFSRIYANQVANSIANFSLSYPNSRALGFPSISRFSRFKCCTAHLRPTFGPLSAHKSNYNYEMISGGGR